MVYAAAYKRPVKDINKIRIRSPRGLVGFGQALNRWFANFISTKIGKIFFRSARDLLFIATLSMENLLCAEVKSSTILSHQKPHAVSIVRSLLAS